MSKTPTLQTDRLTLRPYEISDFKTYAAALASARAQYMGGPLSQQQSWAMFCKDVAQWALLGHGAWAVDETSTGEFLGQVGLNGHPYFPETELGWLVLPEAEGKGIAFEAADMARNWAFETLRLEALVSYIHKDNIRSITLAKRLGAALDTNAAPCPYAGHLVYRHPAPEVLQ